jgi:hypothetical protein
MNETNAVVQLECSYDDLTLALARRYQEATGRQVVSPRAEWGNREVQLFDDNEYDNSLVARFKYVGEI